MTGSLILDPLVPLALLAVVAAIALAGTLIAVVRGLNGWALRGLAALVVLGALAGPSYQQEDRAPLSDIVLMVEDQSASQRLGDRATQSTEAANALAASITARPNTELRRVTVPDGVGDAGTELMRALTDALAEEPRARIAGMIAITDGHEHDAEQPHDQPPHQPQRAVLDPSRKPLDRAGVLTQQHEKPQKAAQRKHRRELAIGVRLQHPGEKDEHQEGQTGAAHLDGGRHHDGPAHAARGFHMLLLADGHGAIISISRSFSE